VNVLVAMSGGVDSSVAAALVAAQGHDVVGVTMRLWGGASDTGCCSVSDVDDARWAAQHLGLDHLVFNFGDDFDRDVVGPYVADHAAGRTPNPCIECNRHLKFDRLLQRARALGFDAIATGHHAQVVEREGGRRIGRGRDRSKDQSYVLYVLEQALLDHVLLPVGTLTKQEVRREAARLGLRTASKPDSQDVCFITNRDGRARFLADRTTLRPGAVVDVAGNRVGEVDAVELVTVGQRKGLGVAGSGAPKYAIDVDVSSATITIGDEGDLRRDEQRVTDLVWSGGGPVVGPVEVQCSAHGRPRAADLDLDGDDVVVRWRAPERRVAGGQSVVFYDGDVVVGGGRAVR
jgi:tRNA-specific 2-thiouridylase